MNPSYWSVVVLIGLLTSFSTSALGWSFRGHVLAAQIAFDNLSATAKKQSSDYADYIYSKLSYRQRNEMDQNYRNASRFAVISTLPDIWRGKTVEQIFQHFRAPLPKILAPLRDETTEQWHFSNQPFPNTACKFDNKHDVIWAISTMEQAWRQTSDWRTKAVIQVFLEHYIADIHQPLHTATRVNRFCNSDYGGNRYYVTAGNGDETNLHKLWDAGVGYLTRNFNVANKAQRLQREFPYAKFESQLINGTTPTDWAKANFNYIAFIYSTPYDGTIDKQYYKNSQKIVRYQLTLAGYRLAEVLHRLDQPQVAILQ